MGCKGRRPGLSLPSACGGHSHRTGGQKSTHQQHPRDLLHILVGAAIWVATHDGVRSLIT
jgi:hypothetical protein